MKRSEHLRCPEVTCERRTDGKHYVKDFGRVFEKKFLRSEVLNIEPKSERVRIHCPKCIEYVNKIEGINHMICKCKYEFCWWCLTQGETPRVVEWGEKECVAHMFFNVDSHNGRLYDDSSDEDEVYVPSKVYYHFGKEKSKKRKDNYTPPKIVWKQIFPWK